MTDTDEITISLNGAETFAVMQAIVAHLEHIEQKDVVTDADREAVQALYSVTQKLAKQSRQSKRDGLN